MRRRTSLLPSRSRKRRERYVGWREFACRMRPLTTVPPPARFRHTYTGPVGTSRRRTSLGCDFFFFFDEELDVALERFVVELRLFFVVVVVGVVFAASLPLPSEPSIWPSA